VSDDDGSARLNELDETEWREVAHKVKPGMTDEEFATAWGEFTALKARKALN
jgi:hypothetical protein